MRFVQTRCHADLTKVFLSNKAQLGQRLFEFIHLYYNALI